MARNNSGIGRILLLGMCVALALFIYRHVHSPGPETCPQPWTRNISPYSKPSAARREATERRTQNRTVPASRTAPRIQRTGSGILSGVRYFMRFPLLWTMERTSRRGTCTVRSGHGYPIPDPQCTPGGITPTVTVTLLRNPDWKTRCIRNCETSEAEKHIAYEWYGIQKPRPNSGDRQVCELDHLVPLELGGADGLGNIWPECGPDEATLQNR